MRSDTFVAAGCRSVAQPLGNCRTKRCRLGVNIRERTWRGPPTDARMQRRREISPASAGDASALLVFSICAVQYAINLPQCGADEGQMRELIGYLVAGRRHRAGGGTNGRRHSSAIPLRAIPVQGRSGVHAPIARFPGVADRAAPGSRPRVRSQPTVPRPTLPSRLSMPPRGSRTMRSKRSRARFPALASSIEAPEQCQAAGPGARRM